MNNQVIKRQVDEFGRIVIPKDIRRQANINPRDYITITCNNNRVELEKNNYNDKIKGICNEIIKHFYNVFKNNIIVTDKEKILMCYGENQEELEHKTISKELFDMINDGNLSIARLKSIKITDSEYLKGQYYYIPIKQDNYNIGSIIIDDNNCNDVIIEFMFKIINNNLTIHT